MKKMFVILAALSLLSFSMMACTPAAEEAPAETTTAGADSGE